MECEIPTSPGDSVLGCSLELGIASLALPLEIDDIWLVATGYPLVQSSWNERSTAISEPPSFSRCPEPRVTGSELVDSTMPD